jgi:hypothetical protein
MVTDRVAFRVIGVVSPVSPEVSPPVFKGGHFLKINWPIFCVHGACLNEPMYWNNHDTSGSMIPANATLLLQPGRWKENQNENPNE